MPQTWYLYVVRTVHGTLYTGIATDVARRYAEHCAGGTRCARYLRAHPPAALVLRQPIGSRAVALRVEYRFKRLPRAAKDAVVRAGRLTFNPDSGAVNGPAPKTREGRARHALSRTPARARPR